MERDINPVTGEDGSSEQTARLKRFFDLLNKNDGDKLLKITEKRVTRFQKLPTLELDPNEADSHFGT